MNVQRLFIFPPTIVKTSNPVIVEVSPGFPYLHGKRAIRISWSGASLMLSTGPIHALIISSSSLNEDEA